MRETVHKVPCVDAMQRPSCSVRVQRELNKLAAASSSNSGGGAIDTRAWEAKFAAVKALLPVFKVCPCVRLPIRRA